MPGIYGNGNGSSSSSELYLKEFSSSNKTGFTYPFMTLSTEDKPRVSVTKDSKHVLILGGGVSGLTTAWMLLDQGHRVTIIADDWAWTKDFEKSRMTSQIAGALWEFPPGGCGLTEIESPGPGWAGISHYRDWAVQSFEFFHEYDRLQNSFEKQGNSYGLQMTNLHQFFYHDIVKGGPDDEELMKLEALKEVAKRHSQFDLKIQTYGAQKLQNNFPHVNSNVQGEDLKSAYSHRTAIVNTDKAMGYLMALVTVKGANFETRKLQGKIKDFGKGLLEEYEADAIVNATGLAAAQLADDDDVYPVRGAVKRIDNTRTGHFRHLNDAYLVPAQRDSNGHPTKTIFIVPRNDDVLYVGSIIQKYNYEKVLTPDSPEVRIMWNRAGDFMPKLLQANTVPMFPFAQGLRPFTKRNIKVRADEEVDFPLVHNYGHGGSGWTLSIGTSRCAVAILDALLVGSNKVSSTAAKKINAKIYGER
jgi:D-amino-acid oxidase